MKAALHLFSLVLLFLAQTACSPSGEVISFHFQSDSVQKLTEQQQQQLGLALVTEKTGTQRQELELNSKKVIRWQQTIGNTPVRNSYVHMVKHDGKLEFATGKVFQALNEKTKARLTALDNGKVQLIAQAKERYPELRLAKKIYPAEFELVEDPMGLTPVLILRYLTFDESDVLEIRLSETGYLLGKRSVAHKLVDGLATVFTSSPARSDLADVIFRQLLGDGTLTTDRLKVRSALTEVKSPSHEFKFSTTEPSFNEVQTFFFINRTLDWFNTEYGLKLPFQLDVKVHIGGHKPSNVAFYYDGNIRLGDGDNIVYKDMPRDPTIVSHEVAHAYIDALSGLPSQGEGGSLNEGFADFFAANMLNTPHMAEFSYLKRDYKRTLDNNLVAFKDFNGGRYHDSTVVSGTFWEIRTALGPNTTGNLAVSTLMHLGPSGQLADLAPAVTASLKEGYANTEVLAVRRILQKRGWLK